MKEFSEIRSLSEDKFFDEIDKLTIKEKILVIQNQIIPAMNLRQNRTEEMGSDEIDRKLRFVGDSSTNPKPGELIEYFEELFKSSNLTPQVASELADITYYGLHINADPDDRLEHLIGAFNIKDHGIKLDSILSFCIIKYSTRITHGDNKNYKQFEYCALKKYLDIHSKITRLWVNNKTKLPKNSEVYGTYSDLFGWS